MSDFIIKEFYEKMKDVNLSAYGILDLNDNVHTLGTDSKIIGRIFEMYTQPILEDIAKNHGYKIVTPQSQTVYPDFVMLKENEPEQKIAIDVKTTYVKKDTSAIKFTLGSFGSYMRDNTKNIEYKYTDYTKHYVVGFVYKRNDKAQDSRVYSYDDRKQIACPYTDVRYFIQEKHKIAGDKPGSGDTENIGSIKTNNFDSFVNGVGPFNELGIDVFDIYWKHYPKYRASNKEYTSIETFFEWFFNQNEKPSLLHDYDYDCVVQNIEAYKKKYNIK